MSKKISKEYKPVRIMNFEFRILVFHDMLRIPMSLADETKKSSLRTGRKYQGT
jgi:hypothetical protein